MTNPPVRVGDRYLCFVVTKPDRGYGGPYGQQRRWPVWTCTECGYEIHATLVGERWRMVQAAQHHECGHAPCPLCGEMLLRRKDGTPRQHAHNRCPGKDAGYRVVREFSRNVTAREYS